VIGAKAIGAGLILALTASVAWADGVPPSGVMPTLFDQVWEAEAGIARFRFLRADLATVGQGAVAEDFQWLCDQVALPALTSSGWAAQVIVISISDREMALGQIDPGATQFFEGYRLTDGACIWDPFG
jgi:hypothetical protein